MVVVFIFQTQVVVGIFVDFDSPNENLGDYSTWNCSCHNTGILKIFALDSHNPHVQSWWLRALK